MRARRLILLVVTVAVALSLPVLVASAWRPEGPASGEGTSALADGPANAVQWLGVVFVWAACLLLLLSRVRAKAPVETVDREVWDEE